MTKVHRIRVGLKGLQTSTMVAPDVDVVDLDWREVVRLEGLARRKAERANRCTACGQAMLCGQPQVHFSCMD